MAAVAEAMPAMTEAPGQHELHNHVEQQAHEGGVEPAEENGGAPEQQEDHMSPALSAQPGASTGPPSKRPSESIPSPSASQRNGKVRCL